MTLNEYAALVARMRAAQQAFFKSRDTGSLEVARKLERQVDQETAAILEPKPGLFGGHQQAESGNG